jgi:PAS domain S-box-containing protein
MLFASLPTNELDRIKALNSFGILDTPAEPAFDRITALAKRLFDVPIAIISLIDEDRQWFKSCVGLNTKQTDRKIAFCAHVVFLGAPLVVEDAQNDPRFFDNPLVAGEPKIRFYAGAPLRTQDGYILGSLCLLDLMPRQFNDQQIRDLADLAQTVVELFELQRLTRNLAQSEVLLTAEVDKEKHLKEVAIQKERQYLHAQMTLQVSEFRYQRMIANLHGMVFQLVLGSDGSYQFPWVSEGCREIYGLEPQQLQEHPYLAIDAVHPKDRASLSASIVYSAKQLTPLKWEGRIFLASGKQYWVECSARPNRLANGDVRWDGLLLDITERKQAQENLLIAHNELESRVQERTADLLYTNTLLRQEEEAVARALLEQQAIFDATPDCIVVLDLDGCIVRTNKNFMMITGLSSEALQGKSILNFAPESEHALIADAMKSTYSLGKGEAKVHVIANDGTLLPYHWKAVPICEKSGDISGLMAVGRDITEQLQVEKELIAARETALEASRLKSEFLANMSHEIRTPMNGVIGMTSLLLDTELTEEQSDYVETVRSLGEALLTIVNDILDFSKIEAGRLALEVADFDLHRVVEEVCELLFESAYNKQLELVCLVDHAVPNAVSGDPGRLRQILVNLVGNAIKFTAQGEVFIHVRLPQPDEDIIRFEVTDTGIGLAPETCAALFQPFFQADGSATRRYGGTGLGLAISKQLIELMGGNIGVKSELGVGSTFWFEVPVKQRMLCEKNDRFLAHLAQLQGHRALILNQNPSNCAVLTYQLAVWRMSADEAENNEQALSLLYRAIQKGTSYRFAILDIGTGGLELARQIQSDRLLSGVHIILLGASAKRNHQQAFESLGNVTFLSKPLIRSWQLLECLMTNRGQPAVRDLSERVARKSERHQGRILVAEDNIINQKVVVRQLEKLGYQVDVVANGLEVLEAIRKISYALILMDCQMPEMDGFETTADIRGQSGKISRIPIIAMTAHVMKGDRQRCLASGMDDYLSKPVTREKLDATLKKWLLENQPEIAITKFGHRQA